VLRALGQGAPCTTCSTHIVDALMQFHGHSTTLGLSRVRGPVDRRQAAALAAFAKRGIRSIEIRLQPDSCLACQQASEGGRHPITRAPTLPVWGCQQQPCRSTYVGVPPPNVDPPKLR
jgi:hypothetical protein